MGRLIDADALDYALGASDEDIYFHHMLEDAPTIDAIPVEWLRKFCADDIAEDQRETIEWMLDVWQQEQGAR